MAAAALIWPALRQRPPGLARQRRAGRPAADGAQAGAGLILTGSRLESRGGTTLADPTGYGLGVTQQTTTLTGTIWDYEGGNLGYRVAHYYFPHSGIILALALNSATGNDDIGDLAGSVYQVLLNADAVHTG